MAGLMPIYQASRRLPFQLIATFTHSMNIRGFSTSGANCLRKVVAETKDNVTVVQGVMLESPRTPYLVKLNGPKNACPLCKLGLELKYTDVLILSQFVRNDGCLLPRTTSGICNKQHKKIKLLVHQAQRAGLMPDHRPSLPGGRVRKSNMSGYKWKKYNVYFTEAIE